MSLLSTGVSALNTSQTSLATAGHNISNVNTEGYSRQRVNQVSLPANFAGSQYIGSGVTVGSIERLYNEFLAVQVRTFTSQQAQYEAFAEVAGQISTVLGSSTSSLAGGLEAFFNAANGVANDPTSIAARQVLLSEGQSLANRFKTLDNQLTQIESQLNGQLSTSIIDINAITQGIAELNSAIVNLSNGTGEQPNDLLDQRDELINRLSEYTSVSTLEDDLGAISIFVGSGQALVVGSTQTDLNTIADLSTDPPRVGIGYGPNSIDITAQLSGGSVGGILQVRGDVIDSARAELNGLAAALIDNANTIHQQGVTLDGNVGGNLFGPIPPATAVAGASNIFVAISDPRDIAAAFPAKVSTNINATGTGTIEISSIESTPPLTLPLFGIGADIQFTFDAISNQYTVTDGVNNTVIAYDPVVDSGKTFSLSAPFVELTVKLSGVPADTDQFSIGNNTAVGDNRNALSLGGLRTEKILGAGTQSLADAYGILIADVATRTNRADINQQTQQGLLEQTQARFDSVSGVNLDEEAANLIRYQQAYQAASQIITVSNTIFNSLLQAL
jgi:flagellar hook-associated protein 1 FlgK